MYWMIELKSEVRKSYLQLGLHLPPIGSWSIEELEQDVSENLSVCKPEQKQELMRLKDFIRKFWQEKQDSLAKTGRSWKLSPDGAVIFR